MVNSVLQKYIEKIKNLQDKRQFPHRPFLLLIIIEMIESGELYENNIPFSEIYKNKSSFFEELIEVFNKSNESEDRHPSINNPFFHLKTKGFWFLKPQKLQSRSAGTTPSPNQLLSVNAAAKLDDPLCVLLAIPEYREIFRETIISHYFSNIRYEVEKVIEEQRRTAEKEIEKDIEEYSESLLEDAGRPFSSHKKAEAIQVGTPIRSAGFRKRIMEIYKHTCAVCELHVRASSGESLTDAAHIIPFSVSYNDDVRNGISLCKSHHWAFDAGLISLSETYQIIVSPCMSERGPTSSMLTELRDKLIWQPRNTQHYPAQDALAWHREEVLKQ